MNEKIKNYEKRAENIRERVSVIDDLLTNSNKERTKEQIRAVVLGLKVFDVAKEKGHITEDNLEAYTRLTDVYESRVYCVEVELAAEKDTPEDVLEYLANCGDVEIENMVTRNPSTPSAVLDKCYERINPNDPFNGEIKKMNIIRNKSVSADTLLKIANNPNEKRYFRENAQKEIILKAIEAKKNIERLKKNDRCANYGEIR